MSNRPHGLRPVWMLAAMVLMAKASKLGCESLGQEACSSEDEDDFSLIQADRSKAPVIRQRHDRNRAALAQGSIASVDKQSSNEASENSTVGAGVPEEAETVVVPEAAVEAETVAATEEAAAAGVAAASDAGAALLSKTTVSLSQQSTQQTAAEHKAKVVAQLGVNEVLIVIGIILIGAAAICLSMALDGRDTRPSSEVGQGDARSQQYAEMKPGQAMDLPPGPQSVASMPGNLLVPIFNSSQPAGFGGNSRLTTMPQSHPAPPKGKPGTIAATGQAVETAGIDKPGSWRPSLSGPETATAYSKHAE